MAGHVAAIAAERGGPSNPHREALLRIAKLMRGPTPSIAAAWRELGLAVDRPEIWLVGACVTLIKIEQIRLLGQLGAPGADILKS